ncbi:MAG: dihydropteroate synthase [Fretibacterium sp.]|nr:dihydropteroate synthase [Fretibacterium sp.]
MPEETGKAQAVYPLQIRSQGDLAQVISHIGADPRCNTYFQPKRRTLAFYSPDVDYRAAAFLKQELLARGGDVVVARHVIDGRTERSAVLLLGTEGQLLALLKKAHSMDCWGLAALREALAEALEKSRLATWRFSLPGGRELVLDKDTKLMGILNLTPDSFYEESRLKDERELLTRAELMLSEGAAVLDVGAESTRPGIEPISEEDEMRRLLGPLRALRREFPDAILSVDTYKGKVALAAADAGADIINDVGGFSLDAAMLKSAVETGLPYVLSHIRGTPRIMKELPPYEDLLSELNLYFQEKLLQLEKAGLPRNRVILDPGLGFAKTARDNLLILKELESLTVLGCPLLIGHSRKRFTGSVTQTATPEERLQSVTAISALLYGRAHILRVHDVAPNRQALATAKAVLESQPWDS